MRQGNKETREITGLKVYETHVRHGISKTVGG